VGTILRSAQAFGAACVALGPDCADPYAPKAVRASMGAIFSVPLTHNNAIDALPGPTIALVPGEGPALAELWRSTSHIEMSSAKVQVTLLVGGERDGLPRAVVESATHVAHIPIESHSLNAAMAATVALYEVSRMARA
jgi:TrmH family RNA methyltransferase